eukprot:Rmarinus@m.25754
MWSPSSHGPPRRTSMSARRWASSSSLCSGSPSFSRRTTTGLSGRFSRTRGLLSSTPPARATRRCTTVGLWGSAVASAGEQTGRPLPFLTMLYITVSTISSNFLKYYEMLLCQQRMCCCFL